MLKKIAAAGVMSLALAAAPAMAENPQTNRQAPAPQGTVAPESNATANTGPDTGTSSEEQMKTQSPGKSVDPDLSKSSKTGDGTGVSSNKEATNPEAPAPNNTVRPQ